MNSSKLNMYAGAFLGTVFVVMTVGILGDAIFHTEEPEQEGFAIAVSESSAAAGDGGGEPAGLEPIGPMLASADPAAGENGFKKCAACHTVDEGGANKVGPNLWNIVNRPVAAVDGFNYSSALQEFAADGTVWDYEHLNGFLHKPKGYVPGTAMGFAGLSKADDRAEIIAYLRTLSSDPAPLPSAETAAADASAEETAAPASDEAGSEASSEAAGETASETAPVTVTADGADAAETEEAADATSGTEGASDAEAGGFAALVSAGDITAGEKDFRKCAACHTIEEGGANKVGPNLWDIVNRPVASHEGYKYSPALTQFAEGGTVWDYDNLGAFLHKPKDLVKGTKMSFAGLRDEEDRANMVAYLRSMSSEPAPLP